MRLLSNHGFYGLLLMHAEFALDSEIETAATDGDKIYFSPEFMDSLSDSELDFVLMHEIMHVALRHCSRTGDRDNYLFNVACDIVVNSNIMHSNGGDVKSITIKKWGESMHRTPNNDEGWNYTAEQVYEQLLAKVKKRKGNNAQNNFPSNLKGERAKDEEKSNSNGNTSWDYHGKWKNVDGEDVDEKKAIWDKRIKDAVEAVRIRQASTNRGVVPLLAERYLKELVDSQINWREILANFVQEEIVDYSFSPPDRRFDDSPFYLPDFNDTDFKAENVLFMIDTSGSMSDDMIT
ncbi:MAG: hypothetical protein IKB98_03130, partial [Clostridia bacterium]|nr:hypothetical protein [Clostridia bacterium]